MGLVANDIKRVLAYSTISQIGYMMLGLGAAGMILSNNFSGGTFNIKAEMLLVITKGAVAVGIFHLFTHAFFKSLLFMGAGSVNHPTGTFDIRLMGGLRKSMPWTYATFLIGSLSLAGVWPLAGFWSKDAILASALEANPVIFWFGMITVFLTAFYMFRVIFMTFHGEYRGGATDDGKDHHHIHESPWIMVGPLVFLAFMAVVAGWWNLNGAFDSFMGYEGEAAGGGIANIVNIFGHTVNGVRLPLISFIVALFGIFCAYAVYNRKWITAESLGRAFGPLYTLVYRKYFFDELYENIIINLAFIKGLFNGFQIFDSRGVDGAVNGVATVVVSGGRAVRRAQTGQLQLYGLFIGIGVAIIVLCVYLFG
jgi:NADH-quinone oxidoreductase subunit L